MKQGIIQQEILINTESDHFLREYCRRASRGGKWGDHTALEELEKACRAGILCELLPDIMDDRLAGDKYTDWEFIPGRYLFCINLEFGLRPADQRSSIEPYTIQVTMNEN